MKVINVIGFEGLYAVSDDGRIFSLNTGKELKQSADKGGYLQVVLSKEGKHSTVAVHKAVFYSFNSYRRLTRTDDLVIDHIDGNKQNNNLGNLRKLTTRDNTSRAKSNKYGKGVHYYASLNKYGAEISINKTRYYLGLFPTAEDASSAYKQALNAYNTNGTLPPKRDRTTKQCKICGQTKPIDDFYHIKGHGYQTYCKSCQRAYGKQRRERLRKAVD